MIWKRLKGKKKDPAGKLSVVLRRRLELLWLLLIRKAAGRGSLGINLPANR